MSNYIWYASYGSNISEDRFMNYISGGKPEGATRTYQGCTDKTPPIDKKPIYIPHSLYFAREAKVWNGGGVCFVNPKRDKHQKTLGNSYLISRDQFLEVVQQENNTTEPLQIDFDKVRKEGLQVVRKNSWYGSLLQLGEKDQVPVLTFTNETFMHDEINPPNAYYLKTIIKGLQESHQRNKSEIEKYLRSIKGISEPILQKAFAML